jgi:hypothetical protein
MEGLDAVKDAKQTTDFWLLSISKVEYTDFQNAALTNESSG